MVRSGTLTLGANLTLGGVSVAQAQDAAAPTSDSPSLLNASLPSLPQNWSDLPLQLKVSETVGYNSNVLNTPSNFNSSLVGLSNSPFQGPVGTFETISDYGASTKAYWGSQQFFADGTYGWYRYLDHDNLNTAHNAIDAGVNWNYTSRCSGKLIASESTTPSQPGQQVGINVINNQTSTAFNETARCIVSPDFSAIFNSGTTSSTNSAAADRANNFQNVFIAAGMTYSVTEENTLQLLATMTGTNYTDRAQLLNSAGLADKITEDQINLSYTRNINTNVSLVASIGVVGIKDGYFSFGWPSGFEPQYSLSVTWSITPKIDLIASVARIVSIPTNIISNLQISESANLGLTYKLTPKVTVTAGASASHSSNGFTQPVIAGLPAIEQATAQSSNFYSLRANVAYAMTPFLGATLSYQYSRTTQFAGLVTPTSLALLTLNYAPY
jgi:hypothetical protein